MSVKSKGLQTERIQALKNIDEFWDDCFKEDPLIHNISYKSTKSNNSSESKIKNQKRINNGKKLPEQRRRSLANIHYKKLCERIPNLFQEEQNNISKKKKINSSMKRSILLYSYGLEVQKANKSNATKNKNLKEQEELKLCTWKPKINKYKIKKSSKSKNRESGNKSCKNSYRQLIDLYIKKECTFKPKINENPNPSLKKIFNKSKSVALYTDRENTSFLLRYKKARDEYIIRKFKKLSEKDDSYNMTAVDLSARIRDRAYINYLNVNNNLQINDKKSKNNINYSFLSKSNYNSASTPLLNISSLSSANKSKNFYLGVLKEQLRLLDLEI